MSGAYYVPLDERADGGRYRSDSSTGGPWDPGLQHGGPPSALLVRAAERGAADALERAHAVRFAVEFLGPVPVADLEVETRVVRAARSAVLVDAVLSAAGRTCLHARVWLVADRDTSAVVPEPDPPVDVPTDLPGLSTRFPYGETIEWRVVRGGMSEPGPGDVWARPKQRVVDGDEVSGLQRVVLIGDSASGISSELSWHEWSFLNIDLDVHLSRPVEGDWIRLDAMTTLGGRGAALARSTVRDVRGPVGCTAQTLILAARTPPR
jgi:acyl-coenzyme A thioesterase PaaI-like protein